MGQVGGGGVQIAAVAGQLLGGQGQQMPGGILGRISTAAEGVEVGDGTGAQTCAKVLPLDDIVAELTGQQTALEQGVQLHAHFVAAAPGRTAQVALVADANDGIGGDIIHGAGQFRINQGHITVRSGILQAVFVLFKVFRESGDEGLVDVLAALLAGDQAFQILAQAGQTLRMEGGLGLADGEDQSLLNVVGTALGGGVEVAHGVQFVAEEFGTDGMVGGGGEDVQNAAADGELTGALHHAASAVTGGGEPGNQLLQGILGAHLQTEGGAHQHPAGHGPLAQGFPGQDLEPGLAAGQFPELTQALLLPGAGDTGGVIEGQFPVGQDGERLAQEVLQLLLQALGGDVVLDDDYHWYSRLAAQARNEVGTVDLADAGDCGALFVGKGLQKDLIFGDIFQTG